MKTFMTIVAVFILGLSPAVRASETVSATKIGFSNSSVRTAASANYDPYCADTIADYYHDIMVALDKNIRETKAEGMRDAKVDGGGMIKGQNIQAWTDLKEALKAQHSKKSSSAQDEMITRFCSLQLSILRYSVGY